MSTKSLISLMIVMCIAVITFVSFSWFPILTRHEQNERAEVIGKRVLEGSNGDGSGIIRSYIVAFKFSDGSAKEFQLGTAGSGGEKGYNAINEGDTGILTYKEIKDIEKRYANEDQHWKGRRFISFEKDPESGEIKIEYSGLSDAAGLMIGIGGFIFVAAIIIAIIVVSYKKGLTN